MIDKNKLSKPLKEALRELVRKKSGNSATKEADLDSLMNKMLKSLSAEEEIKFQMLVDKYEAVNEEDKEKKEILRKALGLLSEEDIKAKEQERKDSIKAYKERYKGLTKEQKLEEAFGLEIDPNKESMKTVRIYNQLTGEVEDMTRSQFLAHIELLESKGYTDKKE